MTHGDQSLSFFGCHVDMDLDASLVVEAMKKQRWVEPIVGEIKILSLRLGLNLYYTRER